MNEIEQALREARQLTEYADSLTFGGPLDLSWRLAAYRRASDAWRRVAALCAQEAQKLQGLMVSEVRHAR